MNRAGATADFAVIGGGIVGVTVALDLLRRFPGASVIVLEKENAPGLHASGRNSGVLHAGFYYTADSLKARFCRDGNRELRTYCEAKALPLNRCGKLVVAPNADELDSLRELLRRGRANGVELEEVTAADARRIEPRAKTHEAALFSPTTATVDPQAVLRALIADLVAEGGEYRLGAPVLKRAEGGLLTPAGLLSAGYVVNAAGLHADRVAHWYGFGEEYTILPFKGLYLYSEEPPGAFRTNIYPVPNLKNPFLGVHFTVTVEGRAKIGPTAVPALWREQYGGAKGFHPREMARLMATEAGLLLRAGFDFRGLALEETRKRSRRWLVHLAAELAEGVRPGDYRRWGPPGIRAQLLNVRERRLVMDFLMEGDERSFHILNAVSPAFTCSLPFARYVGEEIARRLG